MKKQSLVKGAFVLTLAAFITKVLVFSNSIVLSRVLGPEGIGLKKMVMPFMGLMMTLTTIGLPVAISRLVAEADAQGNRGKVKKILVISLVITGSLSIFVVSLSIFSGKYLSSFFLTDPRSYNSFMAMIPIIPIGAVSGVLKGYFRGRQTMNPIAFAQVFEQIVRVCLTYILVQRLVPLGIEYAAAGAVLCSVLGEACSLIFFIVMFKISHHRKMKISRPSWSQAFRGKNVLIELLQTGLPTTGNGFVISITRAVQPIVITKSLALAGVSSALITKQYGMLTGFVMPLLFLPGFINQSLGATLVPAISEANAQNNLRLIKRRLNQAIRVALIVGVPSTLLLYLYAHELMTAVYHAPTAAPLLKLIAPFFLLNYLQSPLQSVLVGMGQAKTAMFNNILARCTNVALIYPLASNPLLGINGVILAISVGVILETILHYSSVVKSIGYALDIPNIIKILVAGIAMGYIGRALFINLNNLTSQGGATLILLTGIVFSIFIYMLLLFFLKVINGSDIVRIPFVGKMLGKIFPK
ncbi:stage V sporulation protein B [Desulfosporosinus nitroreducens]|uniref:Stage V sporulation protein B n=1 Tax=Desulfosporosinus nitroreducens TaxID=2018668 RepID=A0ABT8QRI4_9FIRM|nr:stage V sporulation protein B [Desulfosporosinus nitroreducens]MCO1602133.1 stage V sporulation protein B [Desulfosporosinus nitroreducens]MDO0823260.1 stage V sporulation protein B [Desulfosporosinus nitroreducens]